MADDKNQIQLNKVREVIELMKENDLVEVELCDGDSKIHLKRPGHSNASVVPAFAPVQTAVPGPVAAAAAADEDAGLADINSPMIGTFYAAPSPDSPPYVKPGDSVTPDMVICIVEAMKVMNEIKAETSGTIEKVLVSNGQAVEFGQTLFKIKPL